MFHLCQRFPYQKNHQEKLYLKNKNFRALGFSRLLKAALDELSTTLASFPSLVAYGMDCFVF